jgi:hypothetical protein
MLENCYNFTKIIAPEKVGQNEIDIYCVLIKDGKYTENELAQ